jgi:hypothetical protein
MVGGLQAGQRAASSPRSRRLLSCPANETWSRRGARPRPPSPPRPPQPRPALWASCGTEAQSPRLLSIVRDLALDRRRLCCWPPTAGAAGHSRRFSGAMGLMPARLLSSCSPSALLLLSLAALQVGSNRRGRGGRSRCLPAMLQRRPGRGWRDGGGGITSGIRRTEGTEQGVGLGPGERRRRERRGRGRGVSTEGRDGEGGTRRRGCD